MNYTPMIEQIKGHEGLRLKPYRCSEGFVTIGYGRNLETNGITKHEAEEMLMNDLAQIEEKLNSSGVIEGLNDARKAVLYNMSYQLGFTGLLKFVNTLRHLRAGDFQSAANEMLDSKWAMQTPARARLLSEQMRTGEYQ